MKKILAAQKIAKTLLEAASGAFRAEHCTGRGGVMGFATGTKIHGSDGRKMQKDEI